MTLRDPDCFDTLLSIRRDAAQVRDTWVRIVKGLDEQIDEYLSEKRLDRSVSSSRFGDTGTSSGQGNDLPRGGSRENDKVRYYRGSPERDGRTL